MGNQKENDTAAPVRVLVVDDEDEIRKVFVAVLERDEFGVKAVGSAREALQILMQQSFDVLVVDLKMQEMDGILFLQEALKIWPWLGVIIVSGYVTEEAIAQATELGIEHVLSKPVRFDALCDTVRREAQAKRGRREDIPTDNALTLMRNHLNLLTRLGQTAVGSESLFGALLDFGDSLATMFPTNVVGILVREEGSTLLLTTHKPVTRDFLSSVENEMLTRYQALSGKAINREALNLQIKGEDIRDEGPSEIENSISVPIILGGEVRGLLTLTADADGTYTPADVSLLYHAANHISAAFTAMRKMHHLATHDPLTGIFNRIRLEEELERAWLISRRYSYSMAVIICDIDHFKSLNDSYGHSVGDGILRDFAVVLQHAARATDIIARYGGDEYVAILPRAEEHDARAFGERLLSSTREHVFGRDHHNLRLTISIGIATSLNPTKPTTSAIMLNQSDRALYTAKRAGRNRICIWPKPTTDMHVESTEATDDTSVTSTKKTESRARIMVVDDEEPILDIVGEMLRRDGYEVAVAATAAQALEAVRTRPGYYDVVMTDLGLPEKSGIELLHEVGEMDDGIIKVVLSGRATVDNAIDSLREGAYDFIQKPVVKEELSALMRRALEFRDLKLENARHYAHLEDMVRSRSAQLASTLEEIRRSYEFTLEALVAMLDAREHQAAEHSPKTRDLTVTLAQRVGLSGEELQSVATGALLHDIGKIGIPDSILLREGPLLEEQWEVMMRHPEIGYNILKSSPYLREVAKVVHQHQEYYDGSGYPQGLKGKDICVGARIFAVVDAYDAMRSVRVYREPLSSEDASREILRHSGTQFDPEIVKVFLECQDEFERLLTD